MLNFLLNNPIGHWVDVKPCDITPNSIGFQNGYATSHEWISYMAAWKVIFPVKYFSKWSF